jgi:hypothetical protein
VIPVGLRVAGCVIVASFVCFAALASHGLAQSTMDDVWLREYLRELEMSRERAESERQGTGEVPLAISPTCLPGPLPANPRPPVFSGNAAWFDSRMRFEVWREPCTDGSGRVATLLRVTPLSGQPFVCGSSFTVIQNNIQYNSVRLPQTSTDAGSFCNSVLIPTSLIISQFTTGPQFDDLQAFSLIHGGGTPGVSRLEVGAAGSVISPPAIQVILSACVTCRAGDRLLMLVRARNPANQAQRVEVKIGVRLPDGTPVNMLGDQHLEVILSPLLDTTVPILDLALPPGLPAGVYTAEAVFLEPALGETFSRHVLPFQIVP